MQQTTFSVPDTPLHLVQQTTSSVPDIEVSAEKIDGTTLNIESESVQQQPTNDVDGQAEDTPLIIESPLVLGTDEEGVIKLVETSLEQRNTKKVQDSASMEFVEINTPLIDQFVVSETEHTAESGGKDVHAIEENDVVDDNVPVISSTDNNLNMLRKGTELGTDISMMRRSTADIIDEFSVLNNTNLRKGTEIGSDLSNFLTNSSLQLPNTTLNNSIHSLPTTTTIRNDDNQSYASSWITNMSSSTKNLFKKLQNQNTGIKILKRGILKNNEIPPYARNIINVILDYCIQNQNEDDFMSNFVSYINDLASSRSGESHGGDEEMAFVSHDEMKGGEEEDEKVLGENKEGGGDSEDNLDNVEEAESLFNYDDIISPIIDTMAEHNIVPTNLNEIREYITGQIDAMSNSISNLPEDTVNAEEEIIEIIFDSIEVVVNHLFQSIADDARLYLVEVYTGMIYAQIQSFIS